ncbi:MAG: Gfo/Idh/MocA family oxidoreductase [Candidatus Saccharibacteria bacterium]|nr:Gfo/Idh/MocA family oxidoreductase [Microbacteriaceae bacterium]
MCNPNRTRANSVASDHSIALTFADVDELLAAAVADAVIIATPHVSHYLLARASLGSGMHVLVEKPMTLTADAAFSLVAIAEQRNLQDRDDELEEPNNDNIPFSG